MAEEQRKLRNKLFEYWYESLKLDLGAKEKWGEKVKPTLGSTPEENWKSWGQWWEWNKDYFIFVDPKTGLDVDHDWYFAKIETEADFRDYADDESGTIVYVNLANDKKELMDAFSKLIDDATDESQNRPDWIKPTNKRGPSDFLKSDLFDFALSARPTTKLVETVKRCLDVYKMNRDGCALFTIGETLGIRPDAVLNGPDDLDRTDKTVRMNKEVSRQLGWAKDMIKNAGQGEFPIFNQHKTDKPAK